MSRPKKLKMLTTVTEVLEALGGYAALAKRFGASPQSTWNWTVQHTFPADVYGTMLADLNALGFDAPPSLWRQREGVAA